LAERGWTQSWLKATALFVVCETIIYASGMTWLMTMIGMDLAIKNMMLWMPGEIAKIGLGVTGTRLYKKIKDSKCA
jgi:biotin transporter BioY